MKPKPLKENHVILTAMKKVFVLFSSVLLTFTLHAQDEICLTRTTEHKIQSKHLEEERAHWVSLPYNYNDSISYPVVYVLDAEWRFELIRDIFFDLGANSVLQKSIIVGIPHVEMENKRGQDLTFSQSRTEYDGDSVDSTWYNSSNSGGGMKFYNYLIEELLTFMNNDYSTNGQETLIGHSYGGYFAGYLLSLENPFEVLHIYDPSIWYSDGEVVHQLKEANYSKPTKIYLTYQPEPAFHKNKVEEFIEELKSHSTISLDLKFYPDYSHNGLFLDSFYNGVLITNTPPYEE